MEDLFSAFFGGVRGRATRLEGRDMAMQLVITLVEAATGVEKEIVLDRLATCDVCGGSGSADEQRRDDVPGLRRYRSACRPAQDLPRHDADGGAVRALRGDRPHRGQSRARSARVQAACPTASTSTSSVPAGIRDGQQIRLRGLGEAGIRGAAAGDLIVSVRIAEDDYLHREGDDLHCRATVSIAQAALGVELNVHGILEEKTVAVPAGSQHGDVVRVKGAGMPRLNSSNRGDLFVHIAVDVPKKLTKRQRELLEEFAKESGEETAEHKSPCRSSKTGCTGRRCRCRDTGSSSKTSCRRGNRAEAVARAAVRRRPAPCRRRAARARRRGARRRRAERAGLARGGGRGDA